ncbi:MAG: hypothetical protein F9K23_08530 [Bacteroidetes bacterium]|nr:MAG: hypothetical protein F9K23_08530 [Bacteroidota bacterium]
MANFKNPMTVSFGLALKKTRDLLAISNADEFARVLNLGTTYYRSVEAGINNLSPFHSLKIIEAFQRSTSNRKISYEALSIFLTTLSYIESLVKADENNITTEEKYIFYIKTIKEQADLKLSALLSLFQLIIEKSLQGDAEMDTLIHETKTEKQVWEYLTNYHSFNKSSSEIQSSISENFLSDVPTIYFDFLSDTKESLMRLPVRIGFKGLWQWEERNQDNFVEMICLIKNAENVVSWENLKRYKYKHLWKDFEIAKFMCVTNLPKSKLYSDFKKNLHKSLNDSNEITLLKEFDDKVAKVKFETLPDPYLKNNTEQINDVLTGNSYDPDEPGKKTYDAIWIFTMKNKQSIGFLAVMDDKTKQLVEGISLTYNESINKLESLNSLWASISETNNGNK